MQALDEPWEHGGAACDEEGRCEGFAEVYWDLSERLLVREMMMGGWVDNVPSTNSRE